VYACDKNPSRSIPALFFFFGKKRPSISLIFSMRQTTDRSVSHKRVLKSSILPALPCNLRSKGGKIPGTPAFLVAHFPVFPSNTRSSPHILGPPPAIATPCPCPKNLVWRHSGRKSVLLDDGVPPLFTTPTKLPHLFRIHRPPSSFATPPPLSSLPLLLTDIPTLPANVKSFTSSPPKPRSPLNSGQPFAKQPLSEQPLSEQSLAEQPLSTQNNPSRLRTTLRQTTPLDSGRGSIWRRS
jgi:hypothetical protein